VIDPKVCRRYSLMASEWARDLLAAGSFVTLDSETTGLGKDAQYVVLAIVEHDGSPDGRALLNLRIRPSCPIDERATAVHGLSMEDLENAPTFAEAHPLIVGALAHRRVVVYNAAFDRRIFAAHLKRDKLEDAPLHACADSRYPWECARFWYARFLAEPDERSFGRYGADGPLKHRFKRHKLPGGDHTALGDARATMRLIFRMAEGAGEQQVAREKASPAPHEARGYWRTYTPEGGGPFGRPITQPYTEWVRPHKRGGARAAQAAATHHETGAPEGAPDGTKNPTNARKEGR
jgi:DNA polymerase-3 subunit epsilon